MTIYNQNNHYFKHFNLKMFSSSPTSKISKSRLNYSIEKRKQLLEVYYRLNSNASAVARETGVSTRTIGRILSQEAVIHTLEDENNEESTECLLQDFHYLCL